jgi:hypothetical protein
MKIEPLMTETPETKKVEHLEEFVLLTTPSVSKKQYEEIVSILEPQRETIELALKNYDDKQTKWVTFVQLVYSSIPKMVYDKVTHVIFK